MKKSYHSMEVPTSVPARTLRSSAGIRPVACVSGTVDVMRTPLFWRFSVGRGGERGGGALLGFPTDRSVRYPNVAHGRPAAEAPCDERWCRCGERSGRSWPRLMTGAADGCRAPGARDHT